MPRLTIPELMELRRLLARYREELTECGAEDDSKDATCLLWTISEDIRDNNR